MEKTKEQSKKQDDGLVLQSLLEKSSRECGLNDAEHRKLTRLIRQADAQEKLGGNNAGNEETSKA